ncbi:hypothetical protein NPIL_698361 [Nephila pilipes]|uniref:Secreted protein n=1 Tax=Nephila pilipes TaxID=299642 RepID=A0A8X6IZW2_NEPPI|nr:hypothetical protein NPIL_698361 [Nephila pilipes]
MLISLTLWFLMLMDYEILSTTVADNLCDFHPCIDDRLTSPILNSTFIKCVKRSHCPISDPCPWICCYINV